ncbi:uncharacterized protein PGTG_00115 [Puccinia graminis f. sp. tritici CRL 75-36-700-3]|uniref:DDE Tnp4 domain-containing protein n=1 Tax=Puccinia graminis f. sp. tritici (strain CRL 75-36-700-3 / race SCCL) TaxID=418459 RepID=E3JQX0_PUCGT|nr:uncharacterized protein PGTG_00115 [Puccinia graminis f. sp. tritici CRL 75-36-700-3]EFP74159.1 hypothetical protein PGTG_00115 [Puccinia graminis f. sp. tritici CRL 75-36-700-3]
MPCKSDCQKLLEGVEMTLIASLWKMKMANQKSKALHSNPSNQLVFNCLITAIIRIKRLLSNDLLLIIVNLPLVNFRLRRLAIELHEYLKKKNLDKSKRQVSLLVQLIDQLSSAQYTVPRIPWPWVATISRTYEVLIGTTEDVFMIYARMSRKSFFSLADTIKNHPVFHNNSNKPQAPVEMQLIVALSNLGLYGNGGSPHVLGQYYNISPGSVENYTNCCMFAIIETLEKKHVYWPNTQQRANVTATLAGKTVFDGCIGFADGTIFPLASAPTKHKEDYWMRKMVYAVNSLILYRNPRGFFLAGEYLLADSAYTSTDTIIPAVKRSPSWSLPPEKQQFN